MALSHSKAHGQDHITGLIKPGDVEFVDPLARFDLPGSEDLRYTAVLFQDSKGFIWLKIEGTLYKYDGYQLTDFLEVPLGPHDLIASNVASMEEDPYGYIWLGCYRKEGLFRYDPRKDTFQRFPRNEHDPQEMSDAEIWFIRPDGKDRVWIPTMQYAVGRGLYMYDYRTDSVTEYRHDPEEPNSLPWDEISIVYTDRHQNIWINSLGWEGSGGRLYRFDVEKEKYIEFRLDVPGGEPLPITAAYMQNGPDGDLYFDIMMYNLADSTYPYLVRVQDDLSKLQYEPSDSMGLFKNYQMYPKVFDCYRFVFDHEEDLWLQTRDRGILRYNLLTNTLEQYKPYKEQFEVYIQGNILCDRSGAIWFSYVHGMKNYIPTKRKFTSYEPSFFNNTGIKNGTVYSIYTAPDSVVWVGLNESLIKMDPKSNLLKRFTPLPLNKIVENRLQVIVPGEKNELFIAARNCLYIFDIETEKFEMIPYPDIWGGQAKTESKEMIRDSSGSIWIGVNPGLIHVDPESKTAKTIYELANTEQFLGGITDAIIEDRDGYIWIGTEFGLNRYDPRNDTTVKISHNPLKKDGLAAPRIRALIQDHHGNLWIGYKSSGLSFLDAKYLNDADLNPDALKLRHYSVKDGLPDLHIHKLVEDHSGNIWISSYRGLSRLNPETGSITQFNDEDGIQVDPFESDFSIHPSSGRIYIGGQNGMISFIPKELPLNLHVPPIVLTDFRLHNKSVPISDTTALKQSISYTEQLDLTHSENFLEFEFAALDYTIPAKNKYKYFMEGVDQDTVYAGNKRTAEYRDLRPGKYTFWVSGSNNDGIWNPEGITLDIQIHPPWYHSGLARGSYILLMILAVAAFIWRRTERLKRQMLVLEKEVAIRTLEIRQKNEQIVEMERLKSRVFTDVSHEIRTPLSLISGPLENLITENRQNQKSQLWLSMIKRNSQRLLQLVNQLLDISRLDAGHMKLLMEESDVLKHLRLLVNEYSSLAESKNIAYVVDIPAYELRCWYDREKLEKITSNLLSNAFKYTPENGTVTCRIKVLERIAEGDLKQLRIICADTGAGIPAEEREKIFERFYRAKGDLTEDALGTGIGLSLTRELTKLMNGEVTVKSLVGSGSVFIASIPLGKEHLSEKEYILKEAETQRHPENLRKGLVPEESGPGEERDHPKVKILIVEDNKDLRTYIRENLSAKYQVVESEDGLKGLDIALSKIPDLIISDVMMPGIDGMELCNRLKNNERTSHIPIIMLTAKSTSKDKLDGLELGADDYIFKPFSMDELKVRIKNLLEQREKLRKKYTSMIGLDLGEMAVTTLDEKFLRKVTRIISENLSDFSFDVAQLADLMFMDRSHLFRKLKALTGESPSNLIRIIRLKTAAKFLENGEDNITKIALNTGFSNPSYFAKCFKKYFSKTPLEYRREYLR